MITLTEENMTTAAVLEFGDKTLENTRLPPEAGDFEPNSEIKLVRRSDADYHAGREFVKGEKNERERVLELIDQRIEEVKEELPEKVDNPSYENTVKDIANIGKEKVLKELREDISKNSKQIDGDNQ